MTVGHTLRQAPERVMETIRRLTPPALLPLVVTLRFWVAWSTPSVREEARRQMRFLLEESRPEADIDAAARKYLRWMISRAELRWHPHLVTQQRVEGLDNLLAARDEGRGVVLNFMHHGHYDGACASLAGQGVRCHMVVYPESLAADAPRWLKQHLRVCVTNGGTLVGTDVGTKGLVGLVNGGAVVALASDVPGRTPVRFAGRDLLGSFGAAVIAAKTGAPLVMMTSENDDRGHHVRLHAALHAADFESPQAMFDVMLRTHERAVLATPEAVDIPTTKWGIPPAQEPT